MIRLVAIFLAFAGPALAHGLNVFAFVEGEEIVVEAKFASGKLPAAGEVRVFDGAETLLTVIEITEPAPIRLPLEGVPSETGLLIEVDAGNGHTDYWILTPEDLAE